MSPLCHAQVECAPGSAHASSDGAQQHAVEIARLVGVGQEIQLLVKAIRRQLVAQVTQRGEILDREADAVEQGDLPIAFAALRLAGNDAPEFGDGMIAVELLDFAFDPGLRRIFDEDVGA